MNRRGLFRVIARFGDVVGQYGCMSTHPSQSPRAGKGWRLASIVAGTALIAGTLSAAAMLAIDRPHRWGAGAWISDFAKSPGMAGLFALVAAMIAFWGIQRQVAQSRRTLDHQHDVEQDRAWWTRFEWAAERAVPASSTAERLPWAAVVSTFQALASSARDDVQRRAVGAIMEVAAETEQSVSDATVEREDLFAKTNTQVLSALKSYVNTTAGTPAQSAAVGARLYEAEVLQALTRVFGERVSTWHGADAPDAVISHDGERVLVEIKAYTATPGRNSTVRLENQLRANLIASGCTTAIVVSPLPIRLVRNDGVAKIVAAQWRSPDDDSELERAVRDAVA